MVDVLPKQAEAGIDIVSDGELGKIGFGIGYYGRRLSGLSTRPLKPVNRHHGARHRRASNSPIL